MGKRVVVVGGGIMGLCSAYYLLKEGHEVTVLDRTAMESGASYVNAGYLTPSHIVPLAAPGMMAKGLKWMFNSSSPFYLKPRLDPDFLRWAWYFYRSSTKARVDRAIPLIADINLLSKELFEALHQSGDLGDFQLQRDGLLMLYKTAAAGRAEREVMHRAGDLGLEARELSDIEVRELQPGLKASVRGAFHYLCDAHTTPTEIMPLLQRYLREQGVNLRANTPVTGFKTEGAKIRAVYSESDSYAAEEVVLAAGSWSPILSKQLELKISLQAGKGYRIDIPRPSPVRLPAVLMESKVAVTPMKGFTRLAGTMELSGINRKIRENRVRAIAGAVQEYYHDIEVLEDEILDADCGLRPVTPDGLPYIGRTSRWKNLTLATGHAMMGWSLGPVTGKLITEIISDQEPSIDLAALHPERRFV